MDAKLEVTKMFEGNTRSAYFNQIVANSLNTIERWMVINGQWVCIPAMMPAIDSTALAKYEIH